MLKKIEPYHRRGFFTVKLGCTLSTIAIICRNKKVNIKFYLFTKTDKNLLEFIREPMLGGHSIFFNRKICSRWNFNTEPINLFQSTNLCKSIVGIDASQLYHYAMCQPMLTGLYKSREYGSDTQRITWLPNKSRSFETIISLYFQKSQPNCRIESNFITGR